MVYSAQFLSRIARSKVIKMQSEDLQPILQAWQPFHAAANIGHIKTPDDHARMVQLADHLVESGAANDGHSYEDLFLLVCDLIGQYEDQHYPNPEVPPSGMLQFLMQQHQLQPVDLPELGDAASVTRVLAGEQDMTVAQIRALASRFAIAPASFL